MYESGWSEREIARHFNRSKTWVQSTLVRNKVTIRFGKNAQTAIDKCAFVRRSSAIHYGFTHLEGRYLEIPKEIHVIQKIMVLHTKGQTYTGIARELNRLKFFTRKGTHWDHSLIARIIKRVIEGYGPYGAVISFSPFAVSRDKKTSP